MKGALKVVLVLLWVLGTNRLNAQHNPMFSQYMFNMTAINPAYTGSRDVLSVMGLYRMQWVNFPGAPRTGTLAIHSPLKNPKNNLGVSITNDRIGVSTENALLGTYAYRFPFMKGRLAFGLQGGVSLIQNNWKDVNTINPDQAFPDLSPLITVPRAGFGAWYDTRKFYLGFSAPRLINYVASQNEVFINSTAYSYNPLTLSTGVVVDLNPWMKFRPTIMLKYLKNSPPEADINLHFIYKDFLWMGASYRTGDGLVAMFEWQINPQFKIGYAFDYALTKMKQYSFGSHELMLRYEFNYRMKALSPRYF